MFRFAGLLLLSLLCAPRVLAATFTVTSSAENGPGSLLQAIQDSNVNPGRDRIVFAVATVVGLEDAEVEDPVDIDGTFGSGRAVIETGANIMPLNFVLIFDPGASGSTVRDLVFTGGHYGKMLILASNVLIEEVTLEDGGELTIPGSANRLDAVDGERLRLEGDGNVTVNSTFTGIDVRFSSGNRIGGEGEGNRIGRIVVTSAPGTTIEGNEILGRTAAPSIAVTANALPGVTIAGNDMDCDAVGIRIQANGSLIRGNTIRTCSTGILVVDGAGVEITENSIFGGPAGSVPIELGAGANDAAPDADTGPNRLQNHPVLTSAELANGNLLVDGTLTSAPLTPYRIELFANPASDPQMRTLLTSFLVTTDASGVAAFHPVIVRAAVVPGGVITATATNKGSVTAPGNGPNDTSEISAPVAVIASAAAGAAIPTASTWALLILAGALAAAGVLRR